MTNRVCCLATAALVLAASPGFAQDEGLPLRKWTAPPYWTPTAAPKEGGLEGDMQAAAQGMIAQAQALPSSPLPFVAITPCRIVDTRVAVSDGFHQPNFSDNETRTFTLPSGPDCTGLPASAGAWSLNVQFRPISVASYITLFPTDTTMPTVSTLTASPAAWVEDAAIVPAGTGGAINVYCQYAGRVVIDVNGYYGPQSVVTSLNTLTGEVTLGQGSNVTITPSGNTLTIAATGGPGGELPAGSTNQTLRNNGSGWVASSALTNDGTNVGITGSLGVAGPLTAGKGSFSDTATNGTGLEGLANTGVNAWGLYGLSGDGVGVMGRSVSAGGYAGRFENLGGGAAIGAAVNSTEVMRVDAAGVHAGPGMTPTPLAYGWFDNNGVRYSGSSNITCAWVNATTWYACTITGESFTFSNYAVSVTPSSFGVPIVSSSGGQMIIIFYNASAGQMKPASGFSVIVFKQ